jgi:hypothetical protein
MVETENRNDVRHNTLTEKALYDELRSVDIYVLLFSCSPFYADIEAVLSWN